MAPTAPPRTPTGPVVLVTGASSGFGRAIAARLARHHYRVYGTSRHAPAALADPAPESAAAYPVLVRMDVRIDASVDAAVAAVTRREARIDAVVNNAGIGIAGAIEDTTSDELHHQFDTNVFGPLRVCRAVLPHMRRQGSGRIVNVGSLAGLIALPFQGAYSASKFAVEGATDALRLEVRAFGIHVSLVEPGDFRTAFTDNRVRTSASRISPAYRERMEAALAVMERDEREGPDPEMLAAVVQRVLEQRAPRPRYTAGRRLQRAAALLKRVLPAAAFDRLLAMTYRLG